jgi:FkbM family methyltransferase
MNSLRRSAVMKKASAEFQTPRHARTNGLLAAVRQKAGQLRACFAAKTASSSTFDGCTFDFEIIPNDSIRHALLRKKYERPERHAVLRYMRPEYPVVELGACIGVVACITNRLLKNPKAHVVVEANPHVIPILKKNRDNNSCEFEILNQAIAYDQPNITFSPANDFRGTSVLGNDPQCTLEPPVTVDATGLGAIVAQRGYERFTLICDIEGQEYDLVLREAEMLKKVDTLILETHARLIGEVKIREMWEKLTSLGFRKIHEESFVAVLRRNEMN